MPMVKARLGSACACYTVDKGLAGQASGAAPAFVAMCAFERSRSSLTTTGRLGTGAIGDPLGQVSALS
jgi:hypothetical protein